MRSEIDLNPSRYVLLNGLPADKDPNMKTGEIKPNDSGAYYPYYNPSKHPDAFHTPIKKKDHTQNVIYQKDKAAYYGPNPAKTVIKMNEPEGTKVKIQIADLDKIFPSVENIVEMSRELENLNKLSPGPKQMLSEQKNAMVYTKDAGAYYDPSAADLAKKKADLTKTIDDMKSKLKEAQTVKANISHPINVVEKKPYTIVQNKKNADIEGSNKFIADNYHSVVPVYQEPKKETTAENVAPAPVNNISPVPVNNITPAPVNNINPSINNQPFVQAIKLQRKDSAALHHPDTQGMKTEKVRIVSLRRS